MSSKIKRNNRDMRERLKEEAKVIENCLKTSSVPKKESSIHGGAVHSIELRKKFLFSIHQTISIKVTHVQEAMFTRILRHVGTCRQKI